MKKTTLYKLVKQALREVILESNDITLANKLLVKHEKITKKEKKGIINSLIKEQIKKVREKSPLGLGGITKKKIEEIYNFLVKNSKARVPLEEIAKDPLLEGINIDGLGVIYSKMSTITLEELTELLPEMMMMTTCATLYGTSTNPSGITDFGSINIFEYYSSDCSSSPIDDSFICCSSENPQNAATGASVLFSLTPTNTTTWNVAGDVGCYVLDPNTNPTFTFAHFEDYCNSATGGNAGSGLGGTPSWINPVTGNNAYNIGTSCMGCAHPGATPPYAQGCDDNGAPNPLNFDCCTFPSGCGASVPQLMIPPASNVSPDIVGTFIDNQGTNIILTAVADDQQPYYTDDGSCTWGGGCYQGQININSPEGTVLTFTPTNVVAGAPAIFTGVVTNAANYAYGGVSSTDSPYTIANTPLNDNGSCLISACADPVVGSAVDPISGAALDSNYVGVDATLANVTVTSPTPGYIVTHDSSKCIVYGCNTLGQANYLADNTFGTHTVEDNVTSLCVPITSGCMESGMTNYDAAANSSDDACRFEGCINSPFSSNFVCTEHPEFCLNQAGTECIPPTDDSTTCTPNINLSYMQNASIPLFSQDAGSCAGIDGCMDNGDPINNSNFSGTSTTNDEWWVGTGSDYNYSTLYSSLPVPTVYPDFTGNLGANNFNINANTDDGSCTYSSPPWGCTLTNYCNYNPANFYNDGTCSGALVQCTQVVAYPGGYSNVTVGDCDTNLDQTTNQCVPCVYGCTDPGSSNYDALATCNDPSDPCMSCINGCLNQPSGIGSGTIGSQVYSNYGGPGNTNNIFPFTTCDDGSCVVCVYGCTDPSAGNYNSLATCNNGSCTYTTGCNSDPAACNYIPNVIDDGSCEYITCAGCMDDGTNNLGTGRPPGIIPANASACNVGYNNNGVYVGLAYLTINNPSYCDYDDCDGCIYPSACNFISTIPWPTIDNNTCTYPGDPIPVLLADVDSDYDCDCNGAIPTGYCDCYGLEPVGTTCDCDGPTTGYCDCYGTAADLCGNCVTDPNPCITFGTDCPDGSGGHYCSCSNEYNDECGECDGDGIAAACNCTDTSGLNSDGCCDLITTDCAGNCGGNSPVDDCGVCDPNNDGSTSGNNWNVTCTGCMDLVDLLGTGNGTNTYSALATGAPTGNTIQDLTDCIFNYCEYSTHPTTGNPISNYVCNGASTYALCQESATAGANQCSAACPNGVIMDGNNSIHDIGTFSGLLAGCNQIIDGCMDSGNNPQTWGNIGPFNFGITSGGTQTTGQAINYNVAYTNPCTTGCVDGPDGVLQTFDTTGSNPLSTDNTLGCCCAYNAGCSDDDYLEHTSGIAYNDDASITDGANSSYCDEEKVNGCMHPGATNYDCKNGNTTYPCTDGVNFNDTVNEPCFFDGCIDDGNGYGAFTPPFPLSNSSSPYSDFACLLPTSITAINPNTGISETKTQGEWLCGCTSGNCTSLSQPSTIGAGPISFIDNNIASDPTDPLFYDAYGTGDGYGTITNEEGSCTGFIGDIVAGCYNLGNPTYNQDDGVTNPIPTAAPVNYTSLTTVDDGSCNYYGCLDPDSSNYFCVSNPTLCTTTSANFATGCLSTAASCLDTAYGDTLLDGSNASTPFYCVSYDCDGDDGCVENNIGTGDFSTLAECNNNCKKCTAVTAKRCHRNQILSYSCTNSSAAGLLIDGNNGTSGPTSWIPPSMSPIPTGYEYGVGQVFKRKEYDKPLPYPNTLGEQFNLGANNDNELANELPNSQLDKYDLPQENPGFRWVSYEVMTLENTYLINPNFRDVPSSECGFAPSYDCCTYATCGNFQADYGPGSPWALNNPGQPTPSINWHQKVCVPRFDGSGQYSSMGGKNGCRWNCVQSEPGPKDKVANVKNVNIDTVEPKDLSTTGETTGSISNLPPITPTTPTLPPITPDTPEITESKKLRKLIKQWRKNNL